MRNKILVFGDSITYGQRDLELGGWANRLRLAIANDSSIVSCHVFNMGISGQTTGEVLERLDRECTGRTLEDANNIIILAAGINDTQVINGEVLADEDTLRRNAGALIETAKRHADHVMYIGLTPVDESRTNPVSWDRSKNWRNELIERYDTVIRRVCEEKGIKYIYMFDRIDPLTNEDGLHPSAEGHRVMAEIIGEAVGEYLKRQTPPAASAGRAVITSVGKRKGLFKKLLSLLRRYLKR